MPIPLAPHVTLGCDEQSHLESIVRAHSTPQALVLRCRLILRTAAPDRPSNLQVAQELHCHRHRNLLRLTVGQFIEDAERARAAIEEASGQAIGDHRPPYGIYSGVTLRAARRRGWRPVLWSRWGKDWRRLTTPGRIAARATRPGTTRHLPASKPSIAARATSSADFHMKLGSVAARSPALKPATTSNPVSTGPGHNALATTPLPRSSLRRLSV